MDLVSVTVTIATGAISGVASAFGFWRAQEKRIDRMETELLDPDGENGIKRRVKRIEEWKEDFRAEFPDLLRQMKHEAVDGVSEVLAEIRLDVTDLDKKVDEHLRGKPRRGS